jgi:hypothetical protein
VAIFEQLNLHTDLILDDRERLIIDGRPGDPMRKVITPIPVGRHHLHYEVSAYVRYYADIEIKPGDNYLRPTFHYSSPPGLSRNLAWEEGQDNAYTFTQSEEYLTYDAAGNAVKNLGEVTLNIKLSRDPKNRQALVARFAWQISNHGRPLCQGSLEDANVAGTPRTEGRKALCTDRPVAYGLRYFIVDNALQVDLEGAFTGPD